MHYAMLDVRQLLILIDLFLCIVTDKVGETYEVSL